MKYEVLLLPQASVIIIYNNEFLSVLLRTLHSVYNRSPQFLVHEILLVNDASTRDELYEPLESYVKKNFAGRIKIINFQERRGPALTRLEAAMQAKGPVLIFLDSHVEVNVSLFPNDQFNLQLINLLTGGMGEAFAR